VPEGAWLLTNYELPLMPYYRSHPGPSGSLFSYEPDAPWINTHTYTIWAQKRPPRRLVPGAERWIDPIPEGWLHGPTVLINPDIKWQIGEEARRRLFSRPVYLLVVRPAEIPATGEYLDSFIWPMLEGEGRIELIDERGEARLYRMTRPAYEP
jgi:hypothetical protein